MGVFSDIKLNTYHKETLANGVDLGDEGAYLEGPHKPTKLVGTDKLRSEFTLDLLDFCEFSCPGCFVNRRTKASPEDLDDALTVMNTLHTMNVECEDLFIGPTDIFSAKNFYDLMEDHRMYELTRTFALSCTSTLMSDPEEIMKRMEVIEKHLEAAPARDFDVFVVIDVNAFLNKDINYLTKFESGLKWLEKDTVYFIVNFTEDMFNRISLDDLAKRLMDVYNVPLRINPSFFRIGNHNIIEKQAQTLVELLDDQLPADNVQINMLDPYFAGNGFINLSFRNHKLYITPFLYEGIPQKHEMFEIRRPFTPESIADALKNLTINQFIYASKTEECGECEHLTSCISRHVLAYMESRGFNECIVPKRLIGNGVNT